MTRSLLLIVLLLLTTSVVFAGESGIRCEAKKLDTEHHELTLVCPPMYAYSPLRVEMQLSGIDHWGWSDVSVTAAQPVRMIEANPKQVLVLLPHEKQNRRFLAWRAFSKVKHIGIAEEY
jgi:hypothetical protein